MTNAVIARNTTVLAGSSSISCSSDLSSDAQDNVQSSISPCKAILAVSAALLFVGLLFGGIACAIFCSHDGDSAEAKTRANKGSKKQVARTIKTSSDAVEEEESSSSLMSPASEGGSPSIIIDAVADEQGAGTVTAAFFSPLSEVDDVSDSVSVSGNVGTDVDEGVDDSAVEDASDAADSNSRGEENRASLEAPNHDSLSEGERKTKNDTSSVFSSSGKDDHAVVESFAESEKPHQHGDRESNEEQAEASLGTNEQVGASSADRKEEDCFEDCFKFNEEDSCCMKIAKFLGSFGGGCCMCAFVGFFKFHMRLRTETANELTQTVLLPMLAIGFVLLCLALVAWCFATLIACCESCEEEQ